MINLHTVCALWLSDLDIILDVWQHHIQFPADAAKSEEKNCGFKRKPLKNEEQPLFIIPCANYCSMQQSSPRECQTLTLPLMMSDDIIVPARRSRLIKYDMNCGVRDQNNQRYKSNLEEKKNSQTATFMSLFFNRIPHNILKFFCDINIKPRGKVAQ